MLRLTGGKGVDHVLDVGGAQTLMKSINCVRTGGLVSVIGILSESSSLPAELVTSVMLGAKTSKLLENRGKGDGADEE